MCSLSCEFSLYQRMSQVDERVEEINEMFEEEKHGNVPDLDQVQKRGETIVGMKLTELSAMECL